MKKHVLISAGIAMAMIALPACASVPYAVSQHTLDVGANQQTDVVWIVKGNRISRCFTDQQGPICMEARGQR